MSDCHGLETDSIGEMIRGKGGKYCMMVLLVFINEFADK
jgi:hypothetical protein